MDVLGQAGAAEAATGPAWLQESTGPAWARALTLAERLALSGPGSTDPDTDGDADVTAAAGTPAADRALRRLRRWKRAPGGDGADLPPAMLATVLGGEARLLTLLAESPGSLARRYGSAPAWWTRFQSLLDAEAGRDSRALEQADARGDLAAPSYWLRGFSRVTAPLVRQVVAELERRLLADPVGESVETGPVLEQFRGDLAGALVNIAARTLVLELNVQRVQGRLSGETGAERFWSFVEHVVEPGGRAALFAEYPVLARLLARRADAYLETAWEFFQRWDADRQAVVRDVLGGVAPGRIVLVRFGMGDTHRGGRSVAVVKFAGGAQVIYKPRPLAVHSHFNTLLKWLNGAVVGLDLRRLTVLDRGGYGWVEFAEHAECAGPEQFELYYRRLGALMALLHAVNGADFHYENLIACGDQPVLVDLETLLHPSAPSSPGQQQSDDPALAALDVSVLRLGLLPIVVSTAEGSIDIGGLGGDPSASGPFPSVTWEGNGTDTMRIVRKHMEFTGAQNRPAAAGSAANPIHHLNALLGGFRAGYRAILDRRSELDGADGLLERLCEVDVRAVLRPSQIYDTLLNEGTHPDVLRDALDRDRHFGLLWSACARQPELARIVPYELAELWDGDIPLFTSRPGSCDLWTASGVRLPDHFAESGLTEVRAKFAGLGEADLARQEWIITAALMTRPDGVTAIPAGTISVSGIPVPAGRTADRDTRESGHTAQGTAGREGLLTAARNLADGLSDIAVRDERGHVGWLGLEPARTQTWGVGALRWDLYSGFTGIALFLDTFGRIAGESRYRDLAAAALRPVPGILDEYERVPADRFAALPDLGGMAGLPGLAYGLTLLAGKDERLHDFVERAVRLTSALVDTDNVLDVLGGSAGTIAAMLAVHAHTGSAVALDVARRSGLRLLDRAIPAGAGMAWPSLLAARQPLTGFSHGAAGIGWSLVRLGAATGDQRFIDTGLAAFRYERCEFRRDWGNWPDYRELHGPNAPIGHMFSWCHGAPGIGLTRADVLTVLDAPGLREDLEAALAGTLGNGFGDAGFGHSHSLCHGDLGNADLLLATGDQGGHLDTISAQVLGELAAGDALCGTPNSVATPSLLIGLAGIGYGLTRLAAPDRVPSVLLVKPPLTGLPAAY